VYICTREWSSIVRHLVTRRSNIPRWIAGTRRVFKLGVIVAINTLILFAVINVGVAFFLSREQPTSSDEKQRRDRGDAVIAKYGIEFFKRVYPGKTDEQIVQLIHDQPELRSAYEPFAEFRSTASISTTLNIHQAGFRLGGENQGSWPLDRKAINIFVFGGSTTIGSGVEDDKTIPAALQSLLRERGGEGGPAINVYNFGVGAFFSSQEVTYFQNQLRYGYVPDMVVFIDGLNDFHFWDGDPATSKNYRHVYYLLQHMSRQIGREQGVAWHFVEFVKSLPIVKLARRINANPGWTSVESVSEPRNGWISQARAASLPGALAKRMSAKATDRPSELMYVADEPSSDDVYARKYSDSLQITDPSRIRAVMARYTVNKDIAQGIANQFGIEAIFTWQPVPLYKYDLAYHPFVVSDEHRRSHYGYPAMARFVASNDMGENFAWCADIQDNVRHSLYVDQVHYTEEGNRMIAECIGSRMMASGALDRVRQRKLGKVATAAQRDFSGVIGTAPIATRTIAPMFGPQALTDSLEMSKPLRAWSDTGSSGVRLSDESGGFGVIYEYFPLEHAAADRTHQVSIRIKPDTSDYIGLVMICVGGPHPENEVIFVNPQTMGVISASGHHEVSDEGEGWTRLTLIGTCRDTGNDRLQVMLYPAHGSPENRGAVIFGGGELRRVITAPVRTSGQGLN